MVEPGPAPLALRVEPLQSPGGKPTPGAAGLVDHLHRDARRRERPRAGRAGDAGADHDDLAVRVAALHGRKDIHFRVKILTSSRSPRHDVF
jgi:hypothetical protein